MINDRERDILSALERQIRAEDPDFALRLGGSHGWARWRSARRVALGAPALVLVAVLAVVAFAVNVSSLGLLFLVWAVVGAVRLLSIRRPGQARPPGSADRE